MTTETRKLAARQLDVTPPKAQSEVEKLRRTTFAELATRVAQRRIWLQRYEELQEFVPSQGLTLLRDRHYDDALEYFEALEMYNDEPSLASFLCGVAHLECSDLRKASDELYADVGETESQHFESIICHYRVLCYLAEGSYGDVQSFVGLFAIASDPLSRLLVGIECLLESENELHNVEAKSTTSMSPMFDFMGEVEFPDARLLIDPIPPLTDAIEFGEDQSFAHLFRGEAHVLKNDPKAALSDLTTAVEQLPHLAEPRFYRAVCYRLLGEDNLATQDLQKASEITTQLSESASDLVATITSKLE